MDNPDDKNAKPQAAAAAQNNLGQALALPQELATDIITKLRKLPHEDVDSVIKQLGSCQIVMLTAPPQAGNGDQ